ncbi:MAG: glycosyltransferase family 9 protein [Bacteroidetes bacterium]|nr:glycosyltransferase family 9 protein [Bacteroidota bacterium]MCW5897319.1 glycosyltransferase family 9 protein [Bacteroidota bacterium]
MSSRSISPQRILFLAEGQLGDLLLLTPALRATKESFPHSHISVLVVERRGSDGAKPDRFRDLHATETEREACALSTNTHVDELLVLSRQALRAEKGGARIVAELSVVRFLRKQEFDTVVCTFPEDRFALWAFLAGARVRIGQRKQGLFRLLTNTPDIEKRQRGVLEYYCDLARELGARVSSVHTEYNVPESSEQWAEEFFQKEHLGSGKKIVSVHPGASGNYKIWPPERYAAMMNHLSAGNSTVLLLRGPLDGPVIDEIKHHVQTPFVEIHTGEKVGDLAAIIRRSDLCITNDSGPRHLAVAVGTPSLAFFRQHCDREWGVYPETDYSKTLTGTQQCQVCPPGICRDVMPDGQQFASFCVRMISVDDAVEQAGKMLQV